MFSWLQGLDLSELMALVIESVSVFFLYPVWVSECRYGEHLAFVLTSPS